MIQIELARFLRTGLFGPVELGMSQHDVLMSLGEPNDVVLKRKSATPRAFQYGVFELYFDPDQDYRLSTIYADNFNELAAGSYVEVNPWVLHRGVLITDVREALTKSGIDYSLCQPPDSTLQGLRTSAGVELWFNGEEDNGTPDGLCAICFERRLSPSARLRQVSVRLSHDDYERLKLEAKRQRTSVAKLCSAWLTEKARRLPQ